MKNLIQKICLGIVLTSLNISSLWASKIGDKDELNGQSLKYSSSTKGVQSINDVKEPSRIKRQSVIPGSKKADSSQKTDQEKLWDTLLPPSNKRATLTDSLVPKKVTFLEETKERIAVKAILSSPVVSAPSQLTHAQVRSLLDIPLAYSIVKLDSSSTLSGHMVTQKSEIEGGLASHKLTEGGVHRIAKILDNYPEAIAKLDMDEKRTVHTLSDQGYQGVLGHYDLVLLLENGEFKILPNSKFTIAFATK